MRIKYFSVIALALGFFSTHAAVVDVVDSITVNPTNITNYQQVNIDIKWTAKTTVEVGDTFTITLPAQIRTINAQTIMYSVAGREVGNCSLVGQEITCTFSRRAVLGGTISLAQQFEDTSVTSPNTVVSTIYQVNGTPNTVIDMTVSPSVRDPNEVLTKFGSLPQSGAAVGSIIDWYARVNCRADSIDNMVITDEIELGHELNLNSIYILEGQCDGTDGGFNTANATVVYDALNPTTPSSNYSLLVSGATSTSGGTITLAINGSSNTNAYQITYTTTISDIQSEWNNNITLAGSAGPISNINSVVSQEILTATGYIEGENINGVSKIPSLGIYSMLLMVLSLSGIVLVKRKIA